jgi:hypothetical protein
MLRLIYSRQRNQLNRGLCGTENRAGGFGGKINIFPLKNFEPRMVHHAVKSLYQLRYPESKCKGVMEKAACREASLPTVAFEYVYGNQSKQDEIGRARVTDVHVRNVCEKCIMGLTVKCTGKDNLE